jgi:hypothetical protein
MTEEQRQRKLEYQRTHPRRLSEEQRLKACAYANKRRLANPKKHAEEVRAHRKANPELYHEYNRKWREANIDKARKLEREKARKCTYGIDAETFDRMVAEQNGRCAICMIKAKLCIDHDHDTGLVRGLLCHQCNVMLGNARDNILILQAGCRYLRRASRIDDPSPLPLFGDIG